MKTPKLVSLVVACSLLAVAGCKGGCGKSIAADGGPGAPAASGKSGSLPTADGKPAAPAARHWLPLLQLVPEKPYALFFVGDPASVLANTKAAIVRLRGTTLGSALLPAQ